MGFGALVTTSIVIRKAGSSEMLSEGIVVSR